ncbi:MAG: PAS domain-containing protein [Candidatus Coproplasma sp.]
MTHTIDAYLKSVIDSDVQPVVICDAEHTIIYMNPSAVQRYAKRGGKELLGRSLLDCHSPRSRELIIKVCELFKRDKSANRVFTFYSQKHNSDVYMIALRDENGEYIGYYEKHESRTRESVLPYDGV